VERIPARLLAGLVVLAAAAWPATASAATDLLPNLVSDPPGNTQLDYSSSGLGGNNLLLRFDGYVHNAGAGAFELNASGTGDGTLTPMQRIFDSGGSHRDVAMPNAQVVYSNADGHNHWHLQNIARYSLWADDRSAEVAPAMKVGFCIEDTQHVNSFGPPSAAYNDTNGRDFCQRNNPNPTTLFEGISSGWRDAYYRSLALQWVVVSDVQPGTYWLREDIDPGPNGGAVLESDENSPPAWAASKTTIPGYVAQPVTAPPGPYQQPQDVTLGADVFGSPGARRFKIATPPDHGTLSVTTGSNFTGPHVTYTPHDGYSGPDQFTYQALDSTSGYPLSPLKATVALTVGAATSTPTVVIDTAPTAIETGHGVQLHATVTNDLQSVTWSVDGVDGGGAGIGIITQNGFYTAPASMPASGHVTIEARSASGAHDQRVVKITSPPPPTPSPSPSVAQPERHRGALLSSIATVLEGHVLGAAVIPARAGIVWIGAQAGTHRLGSCRGRVPTGARFTCDLNVKPGTNLNRLKIVAKLKRRTTILARVARFGAPRRARHR
jgi:lysyl oxidase/Big-like domain-containing protein